LGRTIFVGNLPVSLTSKAINKHFRTFGAIDSIRCRSFAQQNPALSKKAAFITKDFHTSRDTMNAYIVFQDDASAQKALTANGQEIEGKVIRVDTAQKTKRDVTNTIFVGNLPFDVKEDELRTHFQECGGITDVRVVRDKKFNTGKGFAFITFEDGKGRTNGLNLNEKSFKDRELRITKAVNEAIAKKNKKKTTEKTKRWRGCKTRKIEKI